MARKTEQKIQLVLTPEQKRIIEEAAKLSGWTLEEFILNCSSSAADWILADALADSKQQMKQAKKKTPAAKKPANDQIFQFNVSLKYIEPLIWRRIQVPSSYTFYDLHVAIQNAFNWDDAHLHSFRSKHPDSGEKVQIGIPDEDAIFANEDLPGWEVPLVEIFRKPKDAAEYEYDFGDSWIHSVKLERILPRESGVKYPRCIDGKRNAPPEDSGGPYHYPELLKALASKRHPQHEDIKEWLGSFDPEAFDPGKVKFDDPKKRFKRAFKE